MKKMKELGRYFGSFLLLRVFSISVILLMLLMSLPNSLARAEDTGVIVSPQIDIFVGPGDQGWHGRVAAFDSLNNRFLVVWTDGGIEISEIDLFGQLVNADGTPYRSPIAISTLSESGRQSAPRAAFDPINKRFFVVWNDDRDGMPWRVYGQLVNADGTLYGLNFAISPDRPDYDLHASDPAVQFDTINGRFLVVWLGSTGQHADIHGQFVNPAGSLHGSVIRITDYAIPYWAAYPDIEFDPNNGRFLVTWGNQFDGYIYGRLLNVDGTLYGSEIAIGYYGLGYSYVASLSFDPINSRFLQFWTGMKGQLINADGTLYGTEIRIFNPGTYLVDIPAVVFDTASDKFLVAGDIQYPYLGVVGQLLNPDGSLYGPDFRIFEVIYNGREGHMGSYPPFVAAGSAETGALVVYMDAPYWSTSRIDIFGKFVKIETPAIAATNVKFTPQAVNKNDRKGDPWVMVEGSLPAPYVVKDIDPSTVKLNGVVPAVTDPKYGFTKPLGDGSVEFMFKFDRAAVEATLSIGDAVVVTITGKVSYNNGTDTALADFQGQDAIKVMENKKAAPALAHELVFAAPPAYPQPCNPETWIPFKLANDVDVTIKIYSLAGNLVRTLDLGHKSAGSYIAQDKSAYWNGKNETGENVSSGIYFYTIRAGEFIATRKVLIIR